MRSQTIRLSRGELGELAPRHWRALASVLENTPRARTLRVRVSRSAGESEAPWSHRLPCGVWWQLGSSAAWVGAAPAQCNGVLRIRLGSEGCSRVLYADLASGDYQIPSAEHVYVEAARYTPGTDAGAIAALGLDLDTEVSAELSDGAAADFSPLIVTAPSSWSESGSPIQLAAPPGAYCVELYALDGHYELTPPGARRDFDARVALPDGPVPVVSTLVQIHARAVLGALSVVFFVR